MPSAFSFHSARAQWVYLAARAFRGSNVRATVELHIFVNSVATLIDLGANVDSAHYDS